MRSPGDAKTWSAVDGRVAGATTVGAVRSVNEDLVVYEEHVGFVLDGMGGSCAGVEASRIGGDAIAAAVGAGVSIADALRAGDRAIAEASAAKLELRGIGATAVIARLAPGGAELAHAGDCRAYRLRGGALERLTRDHDLVRLLEDEGRSADEIARLTTSARHVVISALGLEAPRVDERRVGLETGDRLVLVSDGVTDTLDDAALARALEPPSPLDAVRAVIAAALAAGARDNASILVVDA